MNKKTKLSAIVLFALVFASPLQAFDWFDSLFGTSTVEAGSSSSTITVMGPSGGGGDPGVDPVINTTGGGLGGGDPGVDPN